MYYFDGARFTEGAESVTYSGAVRRLSAGTYIINGVSYTVEFQYENGVEKLAWYTNGNPVAISETIDNGIYYYNINGYYYYFVNGGFQQKVDTRTVIKEYNWAEYNKQGSKPVTTYYKPYSSEGYINSSYSKPVSYSNTYTAPSSSYGSTFNYLAPQTQTYTVGKVEEKKEASSMAMNHVVLPPTEKKVVVEDKAAPEDSWMPKNFNIFG